MWRKTARTIRVTLNTRSDGFSEPCRLNIVEKFILKYACKISLPFRLQHCMDAHRSRQTKLLKQKYFVVFCKFILITPQPAWPVIEFWSEKNRLGRRVLCRKWPAPAVAWVRVYITIWSFFLYLVGFFRVWLQRRFGDGRDRKIPAIPVDPFTRCFGTDAVNFRRHIGLILWV